MAMYLPDIDAHSLLEPVGRFSWEKPLGYFEPYQENGGNIVAIAGQDYVLIASDTRLCGTGFLIHLRNQNKLFRLSEKTVIGSCGCWCDVLAFTRMLDIRMKMYEYEHHKIMSTNAVAQLVSWSLYQKRAFPFGIANIVAGLDAEGKGCVFSFDPVGHLEKDPYRAVGTASAIVQPFLDVQIGRKTLEESSFIPIPQEHAMTVIKDVFISAAERDVYTGDGVICYTITKKSITTEEFPLRKD